MKSQEQTLFGWLSKKNPMNSNERLETERNFYMHFHRFILSLEPYLVKALPLSHAKFQIFLPFSFDALTSSKQGTWRRGLVWKPRSAIYHLTNSSTPSCWLNSLQGPENFKSIDVNLVSKAPIRSWVILRDLSAPVPLGSQKRQCSK